MNEAMNPVMGAIDTSIVGAKKVELAIVVTRANGQVEDLGTVAKWTAPDEVKATGE